MISDVTVSVVAGLLISAVGYGGTIDNCPLRLTSDSPPSVACSRIPKHDRDSRNECLKKAFPPPLKTNSVSTSGFFVLEAPHPICLGDQLFKPSESPLLVIFNRTGQPFAVLNFFGDVRRGRLTFRDSICIGKEEDHLSAQNGVGFFPPQQRLVVRSLTCDENGAPTIRTISLQNPMTLCGATFATGTIFQINIEGRPISFRAKNRLYIANGDQGTKVIAGREYLNPDPERTPCSWVALQ